MANRIADEEERAFAAVFPLPEALISRILDEKKLVFAKFLPHQGCMTRIGPGTRILFYQSRGNRTIPGEACVSMIEFKHPSLVEREVSGRLFLTDQELRDYVRKYPGRQEKEMLVIHLNKSVRYKKPLKWRRRMTMAGQYVSEEEYSEMTRAATAEGATPCRDPKQGKWTIVHNKE